VHLPYTYPTPTHSPMPSPRPGSWGGGTCHA
jgi:hypothetical protein